RAVSRSVREIFKRHTDLIEPLSLDEAYLDVSENKTGLATATLVARTIREQVRQELNLTASAGVAPNKLLAKLASDWRKPDGLFVIRPEMHPESSRFRSKTEKDRSTEPVNSTFTIDTSRSKI